MFYFVFEGPYLRHFSFLLQGPTYTFDDRRTRHHACNSPLIPDPYEIGTIAIKKSKLHGSGEGVFLKVDVPAGRIVAFYNGVHKTELEIVSMTNILDIPMAENIYLFYLFIYWKTEIFDWFQINNIRNCMFDMYIFSVIFFPTKLGNKAKNTKFRMIFLYFAFSIKVTSFFINFSSLFLN